MSRRTGTAIVLCGLLLAAGCSAAPSRPKATVPSTAAPTVGASGTSGASPGAPGAGATVGGVARPDHVVVAVFENKAYRDVAGSAQAPYLNALIHRGATFTNARAETHPSQPNYLALFSGSTQGVTDDHCLSPISGKPNLGSELVAAGFTFTGYSEDLPSPGYRGCSHGRYAAKHNPWVDFANVPAAANQPYTTWPADPARLPTVAFVIPNLCNDMHDCGIGTGDSWAKTHLDPYLRWADTHRSLLIVTFDENDGSSGNQILTVVAGAGVRPAVHPEPINHYTLLRTVEDWYGLPPTGNAASAAPIAGLG